MPTIKGYAYYACIQTPKLKYQSEDKEYAVTLVINEEDAKEFKAKFKKQKPKQYDAEEFAEAYKGASIPNGEDTAYVVTLKTPATYKDGNAVKPEHRPKVFMKNAAGKLQDVTQTTLVGNGSLVEVSYREITHPQYGLIARLDKGLRVDELVPYAGSGDATGGLGELDDSAGELGSTEEPKKPTEATAKAESKPAKKTKAKVVEEEDEEDGNEPF